MKEKYKCLYEVTGNIEDVATFLVPLKDLKTFLPLTDEQTEIIYKAWRIVGADLRGLSWGDFVKEIALQEAAHGIKGEA